jgi:polyphenol oxidase
LLNAGIPDQYIEVSPFSTVSHNGDYFSHRTEKGVTGRMLGAIGLLEQCFAIL